jgi:type IX secretion system PorP/SprF family membrane protein
MAKYSGIIVLMFIFSGVHAQFVPNSSQMFQFASGYNPAFTGVEPYMDVKLGYRYQWTGLGENSPKFINLALNARLTQPVDLVTHAPHMSNAGEVTRTTFVPAGKRMFHGFGVNLFNESNNLLARVGGTVNYAIHYPVTEKMRISFGVAGVIENTKLDFTKIHLGNEADPDPYYDHLVNAGGSHTEVSVRGGALLYTKNFYFGVSYLPVFNKVLKSSDVNFSDPFYRGTIQTGVSFQLGPGLILKPSVLALLQMDNDFAMDYSVKAFIQEKAWFGVTYRDVKSSVLLLGFNVNQLFGVAYSYEMSMDGFKKFNDGSHELVLSLRFNNFKRQMPSIW